MSTILNASTLFRDDVLCQNGNNLGILVNIIFNPPDPTSSQPQADSYLVVFPGPLTRFNIRRLLGFGLDITEEKIKEYPIPFAEKIDEYFDKAAEEGRKIVEEELINLLKESEDKINQSYYLIPINEIDKTSKKKIYLKASKEEYSDCLFFSPVDNGICYYNDIAYVDTDNVNKITLDKGSIKGQLVTDSLGQQARITDVILNTETGCLHGFTVRAFGRGAGKKSLNIKDFVFDTMTCIKPFTV